jgi:kanamycin kinase/aminoglycoside 3'-phosphotransferase-2
MCAQYCIIYAVADAPPGRPAKRGDQPMIPLPPDLAALARGCTWERITIGESGARVYRLRSGAATHYLKVEPLRLEDEPHAEAARLRWLRGLLPVPALRYADDDGRQRYMLTAEVPGSDATDERWLAEPARLVALLAEGLRRIHRQPIAGCPFDQRLDAELARAADNLASGAVDVEDFDAERIGRSPASLLAELHATRPHDEDLVLTHGDYCLPNVIIAGWALSGFIDLGRCGVADRYHDLAQATRSVRRNLGARWAEPFLAAYGIERPDEAKLRYYQLLDEFF